MGSFLRGAGCKRRECDFHDASAGTSAFTARFKTDGGSWGGSAGCGPHPEEQHPRCFSVWPLVHAENGFAPKVCGTHSSFPNKLGWRELEQNKKHDASSFIFDV